MSVQKISSELLNLLYPNLVWSCIIAGRSVLQNNWVAIITIGQDIIFFMICVNESGSVETQHHVSILVIELYRNDCDDE